MDIYQHFRKEEHGFIDQVLSWKEQVERTFSPKLTDFLDPREQQIIEMLIGTNHDDLKLSFFGGSNHNERKRAIIAPFYEEITQESYQLSLLQANYHEKFITLEHRDVMGTFLSLGIKRKKLGDIFAGNGKIQIVVAKEISTYVLTTLHSIKKANITFEEIPLIHFIQMKNEWTESEKTVSSLRLDAVLKEIYHISRKDSAECIKKQLVKVNYKVVEEVNFPLQEGDLISLRGKGRSKIVKMNGQSKKEKWKITIAILK
ncbi:RNA-binding protein [Oceanobacillus caeni]|uniref:RNA-binding protein S4 n=2 Tax=Bacillaceae TaxID=186817 RepID=A0ABR5MLV7_9BACI|nr:MULTISPECIES: RNA-binding protein [Bacillaceae]KKE78048.1 RNA-binding protein S4 [Bacilli bacterium VT-13-104]PZD85704.1 RNA-binding protein [Bacilli bacterium]KPH77169.1 RNA-binding protein S4 [Oceanobacillus caeni]MBU8790165.1 RNA-binding protein [Oceanobacillus caeni]MCR1835609.1 RNA-binding protein [Oceanobacillus caeni]